MPSTPFNPLDIGKLGEIIALELIAQRETALQSTPRRVPFEGAGIYAIYYHGNFSHYEPLIKKNDSLKKASRPLEPIYVGKAVPAGSRTGGDSNTVRTRNKSVSKQKKKYPLHERLTAHASSISKCENINVCNFTCRWLEVEETFIFLGELHLIKKFMPIWNVVVDGFGSRQAGKRRPQARSQWDTIHPGRPWATSLPDNNFSSEQMLSNLADYFAGKPAVTLDPDIAARED